ncbi:Uncharacterized protein dnm_024260 [Desulfonema magnum]|uniref:Uncharacterized protein n=1 Tax=Desulfonema magnum TaxID=45655 RepID=A0A975BJB8_9BACT|nr:Uncharacterized protein dnm_024260 [Desulfonema magnum]
MSFPSNGGETPAFSCKGECIIPEKTRVSFPGRYQKTYGLLLIF